jgi:hypothetical protein
VIFSTRDPSSSIRKRRSIESAAVANMWEDKDTFFRLAPAVRRLAFDDAGWISEPGGSTAGRLVVRQGWMQTHLTRTPSFTLMG